MLRGVVTLRLGEHPGGEIQRGHHAARLTPIAVSYTHLDVYKRQERQHPLMEEGNNNDQGGGDRQIFTEVNFLHGRYPHQVEDVYKRQ